MLMCTEDYRVRSRAVGSDNKGDATVMYRLTKYLRVFVVVEAKAVDEGNLDYGTGKGSKNGHPEALAAAVKGGPVEGGRGGQERIQEREAPGHSLPAQRSLSGCDDCDVHVRVV